MPTSVDETERIWNSLNHKIAECKIDLEEGKLLAVAKQRLKSFHYSSEQALEDFVQDRVKLLKRMVSLYLESYCSTWKEQGERESKAFWDCMWKRIVMKTFEWNENALRMSLEATLIVHGFPIGGISPDRSRTDSEHHGPLSQDEFEKAIMELDPDLNPLQKKGTALRRGLALYKKAAKDFRKELWRRSEIAKFQTDQIKRVRAEVAPTPSILSPASTSEPKLPKPIREGKRCLGMIDEVKRIKNMCTAVGMNIKEIKKDWPDYAIWEIVDGLSKEDQETFGNPTGWGTPTGYAKLILSKHYRNSPETITDWVKAYRKHEKLKHRKK